MQMIDFIVLGIALVALIIGVVKGFMGMIFGIFSLFVALAVGGVACSPTATLINEKSDLDLKLTNSLQGVLESPAEFMAMKLFMEDSTLYLVQDDGTITMGDYLASNAEGGFGKAFAAAYGTLEGKIVGSLPVPTSEEEAISLGGLLAPKAASIVMVAAVFIVLFILTLIILSIIHRFTEVLLRVKALKILDRILGVALSVGIYAVFLCGLLLGASKFLSGSATVMNLINSSVVLKALLDLPFMDTVAAMIPSIPAIGGGGGGEEAAAEAIASLVDLGRVRW